MAVDEATLSAGAGELRSCAMVSVAECRAGVRGCCVPSTVCPDVGPDALGRPHRASAVASAVDGMMPTASVVKGLAGAGEDGATAVGFGGAEGLRGEWKFGSGRTGRGSGAVGCG